MLSGQERTIRQITNHQNGSISWWDLLEQGLSPSQIKTRVARGELVWVFPHAYVAGDPSLIPLCRETAALISIGPDAVLSHRSAAVVWKLVAPTAGLIDVTVPRKVRRRDGLRIHRVKDLKRADVRSRSNIRLTSPARTVIDFAADASPDEVEQSIADGMVQRLVGERELRQAMTRVPANDPGAAAVRALLARDGGAVMTRSGGERKLRALLRAAGLPQPISNTTVEGFEVDFYWPEHKLVAELDGYPFHSGRRVFERDRRKDQVLKTLGVDVIRVTGRQLRDEPFAVIARLAQVLITRAA